MVNNPQVSQAMKDVLAYAFAAGLALIAADSIAYLFSWRHAGVMFAIGMVLTAASALCSALKYEKAKAEDIVVVAMAGTFFAWLLMKQFF